MSKTAKFEKDWYVLYIITNLITKEKYVGYTKCPYKNTVKALNVRFERHIQKSKYSNDTLICKNIKQYGRDNFIISLVKLVQGHKQVLFEENELIKTNQYILNIAGRIPKKKRIKFDDELT